MAIPFRLTAPILEWNQLTSDVEAMSTQCSVSLNHYDVSVMNCDTFAPEPQWNMTAPIYLLQQPYAESLTLKNDSIGFMRVDTLTLRLYFGDSVAIHLDLAGLTNAALLISELQLHALSCVANLFLTNGTGVRAIDLATSASNQSFLNAETYALYVRSSACSPSPIQALATKRTWVSAYKTMHPYATIIAFMPAFLPFIVILMLIMPACVFFCFYF